MIETGKIYTTAEGAVTFYVVPLVVMRYSPTGFVTRFNARDSNTHDQIEREPAYAEE
jgi:hypothetical protein